VRAVVPQLRGFVVLEGVGHWPQLEAPDEVNRSLLRFLAGL
jgi:pimeloyl-ACP methyl ester carboxylesterase